jgi:hypothetical protein
LELGCFQRCLNRFRGDRFPAFDPAPRFGNRLWIVANHVPNRNAKVHPNERRSEHYSGKWNGCFPLLIGFFLFARPDALIQQP